MKLFLTTVVGGFILLSQNEASARDGREWMEVAKEAAAQKNVVKTVRAYKQAARFPETQDEATLALGHFIMEVGDPKTAGVVLERYNTEKNAFNIDAYLLEAEAAYQAQDYGSAIRTLDLIETLHANYIPATEVRGVTLYEMKQNDSAISYLSTYLKDHSNAYRARLTRGKAYLSIGRTDVALADFKVVNNQNPTDAQPLVLIGDAHFAANHFVEADKAYKTALEISPKDAAIYEKIATVQGKLNDGSKNPAEMISFLNKSIELDPKNLEMGSRLADVYIQRKMYTEAEKEYRRELTINPSYDVAARGLVELLSQKGKWDEVGRMLASYTEKNPLQTWATKQYVELLLKISRFYMAEATIMRNRNATGDTPESFIMEANLRQAEGNSKQALDILYQAERGRPGDSQLTFGLGVTEEEAGNYDKAITRYRAIKSDDPLASKAQMRLAMTLEKMGNVSESVQTFKEIAKRTEKVDKVGKDSRALAQISSEHSMVQNKINELEGLVRARDSGKTTTTTPVDRAIASKKKRN